MTKATTSPIDTGRITGRRELRFTRIDEVLADVDRLAAAEREGRLQRLGNWTFGQTLGHLAGWADYSYDGVPLQVPFFVRLMMRPMKRRFLRGPMPAGRNISKVPGGTLATEALSSEEGLSRFRRSFIRLRDQSPTRPHLLFGPLTHEQWTQSHLRHAELHLSFLRAE
jgi:hypothetical protein